MGRPRKVDDEGLAVVEGLAPQAEEISPVRTDGKVAVMKDGVTRRIRPDQLAEWQSQGWQ